MTVARRPLSGARSCLRPLSDIANTERRLPDEFINAEGNNITDAFIEYALPLIGGPLPQYVRL